MKNVNMITKIIAKKKKKKKKKLKQLVDKKYVNSIT